MRSRVLVGIGAVTLAVVGFVAAPSASATPAHTTITGSGSSWAANLISNWTANLNTSGIRVNYAATGSSRGRSDFVTDQVDFAVTDLTYSEAHEWNTTRAYAYVPLAAGALSFAYNVVVGGTRKTDVRLSGATLAGIFGGRIRNWNDPAITADNHGRQVARNLAIIPVIRSDGSAPSYRLTDWFSTQFADTWRYTDQGATAIFPNAGGRVQAKTGSDGVINYVRQSYANGAIGYVENNYAVNSGFPTVAVANASRHFIPPDADNVSLSLQRKARTTADGSADLHLLYTDPDPRVYPLSYYTYGVVPTGTDPRSSAEKRQTLVDFIAYALCQGQSAADQLGYAALPLRLTRAGLTTGASIAGPDTSVSTRSLALSTCTNPTFTRTADGGVADTLDASVPQPPACSAYDAAPCRES